MDSKLPTEIDEAKFKPDRGDGIEEFIVRNNGYESSTFGIYEFNGTQLKQVFDGAGYGC